MIPRRKRSEPILNTQIKKLLFVYIFLMESVLIGLFYYFWKMSGDIEYVRTIMFASLSITSPFLIYSVRGLKDVTL